jgi:hypothetical protein
MRMFFGGSEVKLWRDLLAQEQVPNVALSYIGLLRRNKNNLKITENWSIADHYSADQNIFLDSGAYTLNKEGAEYTREEASILSEHYTDFVKNNIDRISLVSEFDAQILGYDFILECRDGFYDFLPSEKFMPIWHAEYGVDELERLCSTYSVVGITATDIGDKSLIPMLNNFVSRYGVRLHGVAITGRKLLKEIKWDSVASMSWLSPSRFGDTIIWVGGELKRYPKAYKDRARNQHGEYLRKNGFDLDKIKADDGNEILRLSLWSWLKFSETLERRVTNTTRNEMTSFAEDGYSGVDIGGVTERNDNLLPAIPETSSFELALRGETAVAKTTDQRKVLHSALIDMQAQRVLDLKRREDSEDFADINLSMEIDRLARLIKQQNEMEKQSFSLKIEATAPASEGLISTMFGADIGNKLNPNQPAITTAQQVDDIHEAEIVE